MGIECSSLAKPPGGCLQYHTGDTGTVSSFNWQDSTAYEHLWDHSYNVCVRQEKGKCKIGWKQSSTSIDTFKPGRGAPTAGTAFSSLVTDGCESAAQSDYVVIPNGSDGGQFDRNCEDSAPAVDKFCGGALTCISGSTTPSEVISNIRPFTLGVFFNSQESGTNNNRGFKLNYRQVAC